MVDRVRQLALVTGVLSISFGFVRLALGNPADVCHGVGVQRPDGWSFGCEGSCATHPPCVVYDPQEPVKRCSCNAWAFVCCDLRQGTDPLGRPIWIPAGDCAPPNENCPPGTCTLVIDSGPTGVSLRAQCE